MHAHIFHEQKRRLKKKLIIASYTGLAGLAFFVYSFQNLHKWLNEQEAYYRYTVPKILNWFYDKIGPLLTIALSLLISSLMITFCLYKLLTYRTQVNKLNLSIAKMMPDVFKQMIDEQQQND